MTKQVVAIKHCQAAERHFEKRLLSRAAAQKIFITSVIGKDSEPNSPPLFEVVYKGKSAIRNREQIRRWVFDGINNGW